MPAVRDVDEAASWWVSSRPAAPPHVGCFVYGATAAVCNLSTATSQGFRADALVDP